MVYYRNHWQQKYRAELPEVLVHGITVFAYVLWAQLQRELYENSNLLSIRVKNAVSLFQCLPIQRLTFQQIPTLLFKVLTGSFLTGLSCSNNWCDDTWKTYQAVWERRKQKKHQRRILIKWLLTLQKNFLHSNIFDGKLSLSIVKKNSQGKEKREGRKWVTSKKAPLKKSVYSLTNQVTTDFLWQLTLILEVKHWKTTCF